MRNPFENFANSTQVLKIPILIIMIAILGTSCASTGPKINHKDLKLKEFEFIQRFLQVSEDSMPTLYRVAYRLLKTPFEGEHETKPSYNFIGVGVNELSDAAKDLYEIEYWQKGVLVRGIYPGSLSESLELLPGDVITSLDGEPVENLKDYLIRLNDLSKTEVELSIARKDQQFVVKASVEKVYYKAHFFLAPESSLKASNHFSRISIGIGALNYCDNDDELAIIMGHELAHSTLNHSMKNLSLELGSTFALGTVGAIVNSVTFPGIGSVITYPFGKAVGAYFSKRYEAEADYHGIRHVMFAGYDIKNGSKVFSRVALSTPEYSLLAYTFPSHPKAVQRFIRVEKIVEEMKLEHPEVLEGDIEDADDLTRVSPQYDQVELQQSIEVPGDKFRKELENYFQTKRVVHTEFHDFHREDREMTRFSDQDRFQAFKYTSPKKI